MKSKLLLEKKQTKDKIIFARINSDTHEWILQLAKENKTTQSNIILSALNSFRALLENEKK